MVDAIRLNSIIEKYASKQIASAVGSAVREAEGEVAKAAASSAGVVRASVTYKAEALVSEAKKDLSCIFEKLLCRKLKPSELAAVDAIAARIARGVLEEMKKT